MLDIARQGCFNNPALQSAMASLSERIKESIEQSGVKVAEVAAACGISPQAVYQWMSGDTKQITGEYLVELAEITGFDKLLGRPGTGPYLK